MEYDLIVIGGGAAGLMAAGTAAFDGRKVLLLEKMEKPARKIRITGKGRCNLTNIKPEEEFLEKIQANREFFAPAFAAFGNKALVRFFEKRGVRLTTERGGRVFPTSGRAWDIADALVDWCTDLGVEIMCRARVGEVLLLGNRVRGVNYRTKNGFQRRAEAPAVVICTGGASYPATGSTGDGYAMAHALGHAVVPVRPSLVPLETSHPDRVQFAGLHLRNVRVALLIDHRQVAEEFGEMAFSSRGVEGPVVLRLSRRAVDALIDGCSVELLVDLKPALDMSVLCDRIGREMEALPEGAVMYDLLRKVLPRELTATVAKAIGSHPRRAISQSGDGLQERIAAELKAFRIPISDYRPFEEAIVTAGGVDVGEVNPMTMESRLVRGLYFAGEVLDIDADTGGYNLQVAFSTGRLAGRLKHEEDRQQ